MSAAISSSQRVYQELADWYERQAQPQLRDRFLLLAADAAMSSGQPDDAERLRQRLLQLSPHHMLKPFASFAQALRSPDVQGYLGDMRDKYPPNTATALLESLRNGVPADSAKPPPPVVPPPPPPVASPPPPRTSSAKLPPPPPPPPLKSAPPLPDPAPALKTNLPQPVPPPPTKQPPAPPPSPKAPQPPPPPLNLVWGDDADDTEVTAPPVFPPRPPLAQKVEQPTSPQSNNPPIAPKPPPPPVKPAAPPRPVKPKPADDDPPMTAPLPRVVLPPRPTVAPSPPPPPKPAAPPSSPPRPVAAPVPPPRTEPPVYEKPHADESPDRSGSWVPLVLFVLVLAAGVALMVYTFGRPFLPPGMLP